VLNSGQQVFSLYMLARVLRQKSIMNLIVASLDDGSEISRFVDGTVLATMSLQNFVFFAADNAAK
jgi:hypothetical protein